MRELSSFADYFWFLLPLVTATKLWRNLAEAGASTDFSAKGGGTILNASIGSETRMLRQLRSLSRARQRGYRFLSSWFESLAVASHPFQPDSFIFGNAQRDTATYFRRYDSKRTSVRESSRTS